MVSPTKYIEIEIPIKKTNKVRFWLLTAHSCSCYPNKKLITTSKSFMRKVILFTRKPMLKKFSQVYIFISTLDHNYYQRLRIEISFFWTTNPNCLLWIERKKKLSLTMAILQNIPCIYHRSPAINCIINVWWNLLYFSTKFLFNPISEKKDEIHQQPAARIFEIHLRVTTYKLKRSS